MIFKKYNIKGAAAIDHQDSKKGQLSRNKMGNNLEKKILNRNALYIYPILPSLFPWELLLSNDVNNQKQN